jgi:cobalt-zinc-cadmium resistance protein CzcA
MRFAVLVRFPSELRRDISELEKLLVPSPAGAHIPLEELAQIQEIESPAQISRENSMRRVTVECNIRERDTGSFVSEVQERLRSLVDSLPEGYFVEYGGQFENQQRAMQRLSIVVPIAVMLIFLMLFSAFDSLKSSLLVMATLPFSLVGGILATNFANIPLSVSSTIGFIVLFGIAVQDGTLLVSFFEQYKREGIPLMEAVLRACNLRFPSVLTTSLTTILGLLPMVLSAGTGSEIQRPLALVVLAGMISATLLTLLILPALYYLIEMRIEKKNEPFIKETTS